LDDQSTNLHMGGRVDGGTWMRGEIGEAIAHNGMLSNADRQKVEGYFAWRWRAPYMLMLPPDHPYFSGPPDVNGTPIPQPPEPFTLTNIVYSPGLAAGGGTTPVADTINARLIVLATSTWGNAGTTVTDTYGNAWIAGGSLPTGYCGMYIWYCIDPLTGPGHTFTTSGASSAIQAFMFAGSAQPSFFQEVHSTDNTNPTAFTPGTITPPGPAIFITAVSTDPATPMTGVDSGFIRLAYTGSTGGVVANDSVWGTTMTAQPVSPIITYPGTSRRSGIMVCFVEGV
jgi:hypothetical protein